MIRLNSAGLYFCLESADYKFAYKRILRRLVYNVYIADSNACKAVFECRLSMRASWNVTWNMALDSCSGYNMRHVFFFPFCPSPPPSQHRPYLTLTLSSPVYQSPNFAPFKEPKNRFQGTNSARLCSLADRCHNPFPTRFLAPIDCLKIPALL